MAKATYKPIDFNLSGLTGISDETLEMHLGLYHGYVDATNRLTDRLGAMATAGTLSGADPVYAELSRRLGFEYGGMVLHEYYFGNLAPRGRARPAADLSRALDRSFGGFDPWRQDFAAVGSLRGVGWAVLYRDPATEQLSNHWVTLHDQGVPSGFEPLLVMDVWEHAYLLDYGPAERGKYVEAFLANIDWSRVNERLAGAPQRPRA
jgi:Fe-Mn family superoxide dismutase